MDGMFLDTILNDTTGQSFYVLRSGLMGFGLQELKEENLVCVSLGGEIPLLIHDTSHGYHRLIGECYLHRAMNGGYLNKYSNSDRPDLYYSISSHLFSLKQLS
jgi:hypothetical protein